jgi:hypothetical protein
VDKRCSVLEKNSWIGRLNKEPKTRSDVGFRPTHFETNLNNVWIAIIKKFT